MPAGFKGHVRHPNKDFIIALKARQHGGRLRKLLAVPAPADWDSCAKNWIGPVKDQSQCGSCWDFSGTCVVEVAWYVSGLFPPDGSCALSEQYTLDCGRNGGCNGDDNITVLQDAKAHGLPKTSDYGSYDASSNRCKFDQKMTLYKIDDWGFCDPNNQGGVAAPDTIQAAVMVYGCVGAGVAAGGDSFWDSGTGVGTGHSHSIDHDVVIVGWRTGGSKVTAAVGAANANVPAVNRGIVQWKMRNSWGTRWGSSGYAWVEEGAYDLGNEACWAVVHNANPPVDWSNIFRGAALLGTRP